MSSVADTPPRIKSDPPPALTVEDTGSGAPPQPSPSPTQTRRRSFRPFPVRPKAKREDSTGSIRERKTHKRKHSPNLEWHEKWTKDSWKQGRVLLIDYVGREHKAEGRRKIVAQEFADIDGLRKFYRNQNLSQQAALRVIHVQNASWATRFLLRKFNIDASDDLVGTTFGRWARYERPQQRGGKPVLNGKTFRPQRDPWRGISRAAFGCDYLKHSDKRKHPTPKGVLRMMELNCYDASDQPIVGYDVNVQRLSVYVQLSDGVPGEEVDPDIPNPYNEEEYEEYQRLKRQYGAVGPDGQEQYIPKLKTLDNGSTIIIFENSPSGNVQDTLIGARQEIEARWRRLTFYLPREEMESDEMLATECMDFILRDILKALAFNWEKFVNICETHVGILEDKLYENPADESRAPELWTNSSLWLKVERLLYIHLDIAKEMRSYLRELALGDPKEDEPWLGNTAEELEKLTTQWEEGVVKPTTNLSDLLYKSVGIRDARHSLQLGLSMWRLSWITFIFLPLTFVCGFFGMNVDTFESNPPIKWFFISIFPLFTIVIISWYFIKHTLNTQRQNPLRRGIYETFYAELSQDHPSLWTRHGPKKGVIPIGWYNSIKWRLATRWFGHDKMAPGQTYDAAGQDELGVGNRVKRYLVERWLKDLIVAPKTQVSLSQPDLSSSLFEDKDLGAVQELLSLATPIALAEGDPTAASRLSKRIPLGRYRSLSPTRSEGDRPGSSVTSGDESGVMVEEEVNASEDERSIASGDEASENKKKRSSFPERLNVPLYPGGAGIVAGGL